MSDNFDESSDQLLSGIISLEAEIDKILEPQNGTEDAALATQDENVKKCQEIVDSTSLKNND